MTLRIEPFSLPDRLLAKIGKKRAIFIPSMTHPSGYYVASRESFLRALLRPRGRKLPTGWTYWDAPNTKEDG
jgi:hypothetical protein